MENKNLYFSHEEDNYRKKLHEFFKPLIFKYRVAKEIKRQTDRFLASDFNLVGIMNPCEDKISDIIAMFLKPDGEHGQGKVFLRKFLEILKEERKELLKELTAKVEPQKQQNEIDDKSKINDIENLLNCRISVEREAEAEGRLDIKITFKTEEGDYFIVGIENKPWAEDQPEQLKRYSGDLENKLKDDYVLLFISGDGRLPSESSIPKEKREDLERNGKLLCSSYRRFLLPWLRESFKECEAEKVRWFLRDFIIWIEEKFREDVSDESSEERNH